MIILHAYYDYLYVHVKGPYITLNMVYAVSNRIITQGLSP
jgi:hypothetical protein